MRRFVLRTRFGLWVAIFALLAASPASAALQINVVPFSASPGSSGTFNVTLTNTGLTSVDLASFFYELTSGSDITLTKVTSEATSPSYIFAGNSLDDFFAINLNDLTANPGPGQTIDALDASFDLTNVVLAPADTVGLGLVYFDVAPDAPIGSVPITITTANFAGLDSDGNTVLYPGEITAGSGNGAIVAPEPATILIWSVLGVVGIAFARWRRRAQAA